MRSLHSVGRSLPHRLHRTGLALGCAAALALAPGRAGAQYGAPDPAPPAQQSDDIPAHIAIVDGSATLERDGQVDPVAPNQILLAGDRLRTARGRVEVLFEDGSALDLDENSAIDLLSDSLARLVDGRVRVALARAAGADDYRVDSLAGTAWLRPAGDYRLSLSGPVDDPRVDLVVYRGTAELANDQGRTLVRAGMAAVADRAHAPSLPYAVSVAEGDEFGRWSEDRRDERLGAASARYLPDDLQAYSGDFDRYGSWLYDASYGYVWYPRVTSTWRPYYDGRWSFAASFGWIWVGAERWSWPTHHYGRWGMASSRWFWIPDRRWAPAWVSWASAPGYVGWCPLGFDGRPVFSLAVSVGSREPWRAWTLLPARSFVPNVIVARTAVTPQYWSATTWSRFSVRSTIPVPSTSARLRTQAAPLGAPTSRPSAGWHAPAASAPGRAATPARVPSIAGRSVSSPRYAAPRQSVSAPPSAPGIRSSVPASRLPARGIPSRSPAPAAPRVPSWRTIEPPRLSTPRTSTPRAVSPSAPAPTSLPSRSAPAMGAVRRGGGSPTPAPINRGPSRIAPGGSTPAGRSIAPAPPRPSAPPGAVRGSGSRPSGPAGVPRGQAVRRGGGGDRR